MKVCSKCAERKPRTEFHKKASARDGRQTYCKLCGNAASLAYHWANRDACLTQMSARYWADPEPTRTASLAYHWANRDAELAGMSARYWANPEAERADRNARYWKKKMEV